MSMKVYTVQVNLKLGNIDENREKIYSLLEKVDRESLVLLPEMWSCGFDNENLNVHAERTKEIYKAEILFLNKQR